MALGTSGPGKRWRACKPNSAVSNGRRPVRVETGRRLIPRVRSRGPAMDFEATARDAFTLERLLARAAEVNRERDPLTRGS